MTTLRTTLTLVDAAVLAPVYRDASGALRLVLVRKVPGGRHGGQVAFPGGHREPSDGSLRVTALREAEEEIGLRPEQVEVLGRMPDYHTGTGYRVTPIVGWAEGPLAYRPDPHEVEEVFEVPLAFLLDPRNHHHETAIQRGRLRRYWAVPYGERYIWGATAGMLVAFQRILAGGAAGG